MRNKFQKERLRLIRLAHGLKQTQLADRIGVSRQYIHQVESGSRTPNSESIDAFADLLSVEPEFFLLPPAEVIGEDHFNFRKQRTTNKGTAAHIVAKATLLQEVVDWLSERLSLPEPNFPQLTVESVADIERAALICREHWGLGGNAPITNMTRVAERAGAVVVNISGVHDKISALSVSAKRPIILHNEGKDQPTRLRFDLGHEVGHFVMHAGIVTGDSATEDQANYFAGAFFLPRKTFVNEFPKGSRINWRALFELKQRWEVSVQAIIRRAYNLGLITPAQYKSASIYISKNGYRKHEPFEPRYVEPPELVEKSFQTLNQHYSIYREDVASALCVSVELLEEVLGVKLSAKPVQYGNVVTLNAGG